jgi:hypothetical protein
MEEQKKRSKNLTDEIIEQVVSIIDGIDNITWGNVIEALYIRTGDQYTRQTLGKHPRIKRAFEIAKERISREREDEGKIDPSLSPREYILAEKLKALEAKNERIEAENKSLLLQFATWAYNAYAYGITPEQLSKELPRVDRRQDG